MELTTKPVTDLQVGDVWVETRPVMGNRDHLVTTIATITQVGDDRDYDVIGTFRHFRSDMVTGTGAQNPDWGFMLPVGGTVEVQA